MPDLRAELVDLRARGVRIEAHDAPDPITDADGVAAMGFAWAAWILDPSGNALAIIQPKTASAEPVTWSPCAPFGLAVEDQTGPVQLELRAGTPSSKASADRADSPLSPIVTAIEPEPIGSTGGQG